MADTTIPPGQAPPADSPTKDVHVPIEQARQTVRLVTSWQNPQDQIYGVLGISPPALQERRQARAHQNAERDQGEPLQDVARKSSLPFAQKHL